MRVLPALIRPGVRVVGRCGLSMLRWRGGSYFAELSCLLQAPHKQDDIVVAEAVDEEFAVEATTVTAPGLKWRGTVTEKGEP